MEQRDNKRALCAGTNYEPLTIQTALTYNLIDKDNGNDNNNHGLHVYARQTARDYWKGRTKRHETTGKIMPNGM